MSTPSERPPIDLTALPSEPATTSDPLGLSDLLARGILDALPGNPPVPIKEWRINDADGGAGLTIRTALLLVALYTRPGDTIVSLGNDPALAGAAGAAGCRYVAVAHPADLADLDHVAGTVGLVVLRWPPPPTPSRRRPPERRPAPVSDDLADLFTACRLLLSRDGYTIVALTPAVAGPDYAELARQLIPAALQAGLGWLQHIVAVTGADPPAAITGVAARTDPTVGLAAGSTAIAVDLLVFVIRGTSGGSPEPKCSERKLSSGSLSGSDPWVLDEPTGVLS
jgi:hypothetical protein